MHQLAYILVTTVVAAGLLTLAATFLEPWLARLETFLTYISTGIILFSMAFVCAEVVMRYGFHSPIPGHLEGSELLVPMIVFFAVSYTQARNGHVGMSLVVDSLSPRGQRAMEVFTLVLSMMVCSVLAWFGTEYAFQIYQYDDVTMTPPYWHTWPSAASISLGYFMLAVRMWFQALHLINPERFPKPELEEAWEFNAPPD